MSKPLIEMAKRGDPNFEPRKFFESEIYPKAVSQEQEREYVRVVFKADYAATIRPKILAERQKVEEQIETQKKELDGACKPDVVSQVLRVVLSAVISPIDGNFKAAQDESGELAKVVRALSGISLGDIEKFGIAGGPNSEFNKILGGPNSDVRKIVEFLSSSLSPDIFSGDGINVPSIIIPFKLPNIELKFPELPTLELDLKIETPKLPDIKVELPEIRIDPPKIEVPKLPNAPEIRIDCCKF